MLHSTGEIKDGVLHIGNTRVPVKSTESAAAMVPDVLFYDNQLVRIYSFSWSDMSFWLAVGFKNFAPIF